MQTFLIQLPLLADHSYGFFVLVFLNMMKMKYVFQALFFLHQCTTFIGNSQILSVDLMPP